MNSLWVTTSTWTEVASRFITKDLWLLMQALIAVVQVAITVPTTRTTLNVPLLTIHCWCTILMKNLNVGTMEEVERPGLQPMTAGSVCVARVGKLVIRLIVSCPKSIRWAKCWRMGLVLMHKRPIILI